MSLEQLINPLQPLNIKVNDLQVTGQTISIGSQQIRGNLEVDGITTLIGGTEVLSDLTVSGGVSAGGTSNSIFGNVEVDGKFNVISSSDSEISPGTLTLAPLSQSVAVTGNIIADDYISAPAYVDTEAGSTLINQPARSFDNQGNATFGYGGVNAIQSYNFILAGDVKNGATGTPITVFTVPTGNSALLISYTAYNGNVSTATITRFIEKQAGGSYIWGPTISLATLTNQILTGNMLVLNDGDSFAIQTNQTTTNHHAVFALFKPSNTSLATTITPLGSGPVTLTPAIGAGTLWSVNQGNSVIGGPQLAFYNSTGSGVTYTVTCAFAASTNSSVFATQTVSTGASGAIITLPPFAPGDVVTVTTTSSSSNQWAILSYYNW